MLNERAKILLKTLVERYIHEGQPVGSRTLAKFSGLDLSPATIRNVMIDLEEMGLVASPHTSAGRMPTALGYRFFVDTLLVVESLDDVQISLLENRMHPKSSSNLINATSRLLSDLTQFVGVVVSSRRAGGAVFRHIEFVALSEKRILLIMVTPEGDVQNRILFTDGAYSQSDLIEAGNFLNQHYAGSTLEEIRSGLQHELTQLRQDMTVLMSAVVELSDASQQASDEIVAITGEHKLFDVSDLSANLADLKKLFKMFERKTKLLQLMDLSRQAHGVKIFIGGESGESALEEVSVVTAPYKMEGRVVGTVGVIGPRRMAYERVIPVVDITAKLLSSNLS